MGYGAIISGLLGSATGGKAESSVGDAAINAAFEPSQQSSFAVGAGASAESSGPSKGAESQTMLWVIGGIAALSLITTLASTKR